MPAEARETRTSKGARQAIAFSGAFRDGLGIALWQADGGGPEPAATGHSFDAPFERITAHYYIASRDHVDRDARGGLVAIGLSGEWPELGAALAAEGRALGELVMRLPLTTAGADREGEDWFYRDDVETRYLRPQAPLPLLLGDDPLLAFAPARLVLTEDYRGARNFAEVRLALVSEPTAAAAASGAPEGPHARLVGALLADLGTRPVRFVVEAIRLTPERFEGRGRTSGRYAEIPLARLEVVQE